MNLHNLDAANESVRMMHFVVADCSNVLTDEGASSNNVNEVFINPPSRELPIA